MTWGQAGVAWCSIVMVAACGTSGNGQPDHSGAPANPRVQIARASREPVRRVVEVVGSLVANEQVTVTNEVPGTVAAIRADFGDVVEENAVLLELDRRELELHVGVARSALAQAEARKARAEGNWARAQRLFAEDALSDERRDGVQAELRVAFADQEAAAKQLALAEKHLADAVVRAPFRASVQTRRIAPGQHVPAFAPLFDLVSLDPVTFRGEVPERFASALRVGLPVHIELEGTAGTALDTVTARVASALTPATRSLAFECDLANADGRLAPGRFARARLDLDPAPATLIPRTSVVQFAGVDRAFVVRDGHAAARTVTVGDQFGDRIEIVAGLAAGEDVVIAGQERLADGIAVEVEETPS